MTSWIQAAKLLLIEWTQLSRKPGAIHSAVAAQPVSALLNPASSNLGQLMSSVLGK